MRSFFNIKGDRLSAKRDLVKKITKRLFKDDWFSFRCLCTSLLWKVVRRMMRFVQKVWKYMKEVKHKDYTTKLIQSYKCYKLYTWYRNAVNRTHRMLQELLHEDLKIKLTQSERTIQVLLSECVPRSQIALASRTRSAQAARDPVHHPRHSPPRPEETTLPCGCRVVLHLH